MTGIKEADGKLRACMQSDWLLLSCLMYGGLWKNELDRHKLPSVGQKTAGLKTH